VTSLILIVAFILCLAMAVGAILIGYQFTTTYNAAFHRHYFYYLVAFYVFAVYGLWGQILGRALLATLEANAGLAETMASFVSVLGVPILFVSWLMLIHLAYAMVESSVRQGWIALHAVIFVLLLLGAWIAFSVAPDEFGFVSAHLRYIVVLVMVALESLCFVGFLIIAVPAEQPANEERRARQRLLRRFAWLLAGAFALRSASLPLAFAFPWVVVTALVYFGSNLIPLFYLRANADRILQPVRAELPPDENMIRVFEACGITKRERQIVREICSGKTNQQIADALFISLQTVKDHTHRIYSKIGVSSRIQLVQKVSG